MGVLNNINSFWMKVEKDPWLTKCLLFERFD